MSEIRDYITQKLVAAERDRSSAMSKVDEYTKRADEQRRKVDELDVLLRHLRSWANEAGVDIAAVNSPPVKPSVSHQNGTVPIRRLVEESLRQLQVFTTADVIRWVQSRNAYAKQNSIEAELSHRRKSGDVEALGDGRYKSSLFIPPAKSIHQSHATNNSQGSAEEADPFADDPDEYEETESAAVTRGVVHSHGPGPGFGRIS